MILIDNLFYFNIWLIRALDFAVEHGIHASSDRGIERIETFESLRFFLKQKQQQKIKLKKYIIEILNSKCD